MIVLKFASVMSLEILDAWLANCLWLLWIYASLNNVENCEHWDSCKGVTAVTQTTVLCCFRSVFYCGDFLDLMYIFTYFAFQLLRKCILNMTIPCVVPDGPLGVPPFEKPSIAKVNFYTI